MGVIIFSILALTYLFLGLLSITNLKINNLGLKWFFILTILLPLAKVTKSFHFKSQISVYYFFFIGVLIIYFIKLIGKKKLNKVLFDGFVLIGMFLAFYIMHYFLVVNETRDPIDIFKDLKPFFMLILAYLFVDYYNERIRIVLTDKFCNKLVLYNFIVSSLFFYFMVKSNFHLSLTDDPYFKYQELRYETLGTYFGLFYLLFSIFNGAKITIRNIMLIVITTLYTGNRTLIVSIVLLVVIFYLTKVSLKKMMIYFSVIFAFLISSLYFIQNSSDNSPLYRFKKVISIEYIGIGLMKRFSPFIISLQSFSFLDFIYGKGVGYNFFIPWFVWRKSIKNYNIYIDNLYLTLYAKYGVFFILIFIMLYHFVKSFSNKNTYFFYFLFILILSITNAMIYQFNFLWLLIIFILPFYNSKKNII